MIKNDFNISGYTTFGIPVKAKYFAEYSSERELLHLSRTEEFINSRILHIGGGSDILFLQDFNGMVVHSKIKGLKSYRKDENTVFAIVGAGEKWTDFVDWAIEQNLAGVENMAGIPGEVGASAVQNVGAYGVEAKDVIHSVRCFDTWTRKTITLYNEQCHFAYRDSIFKHEYAGRFFILSVSFRLHPDGKPVMLDYSALKNLKETKTDISLQDVRDFIISTRNKKLPDPDKIGNAGSFFKNPIVNRYFFDEEIKPHFPEMPVYPVKNSEGVESKSFIKLSAGWMIDKAGLKNMSIGDAAVYEGNALVIINRGNATSDDVYSLANRITDIVNKKYKVLLQPEVHYISSEIKVTFLGTGTSKGVPEIGCQCNTCTSEDPRDKRLRASVLIETNGKKILIDASPDLRQQALVNNISHLDAILLTHIHYDHVGGIDDLRPLSTHGDIPMYMKPDVSHDLHRRLDYCFRENPYPGVPKFDVREIDDTPFVVDGIKVIPVEVMHGKLPITGYRIGDFAYLTDVKTISDYELEKLAGVKVLVINALRQFPHFAHLDLEEALSLIKRINPQEAYLTHFSHEMGKQADVEPTLPPHVHFAYDNLSIIV